MTTGLKSVRLIVLWCLRPSPTQVLLLVNTTVFQSIHQDIYSPQMGPLGPTRGNRALFWGLIYLVLSMDLNLLTGIFKNTQNALKLIIST